MRISLALAASLIAAAAFSPARAQLAGGAGGPGSFSYGSNGTVMEPAPGIDRHKDEQDDQGQKGGDKEDKPAPPPAAIPGAIPDENAAVAPADKVAAEMSPNDALFDAITRGDLAAAKDALNRGAQLDAHNVLGQNPIDAAVDLDRNDITFLLLSMRSTAQISRYSQAQQAAPAPVAKPVKATRIVADRGTPNPAVGFTGF